MAPPLALLWYLLGILAILLIVTNQGRRVVLHCAQALLNGQSPLRWLAGLLAGVLPPVLWTLAFKLARNIPSGIRPEIHTRLLPVLEALLLSPCGIVLFGVLLTPIAYLVRSRTRSRTSRTFYPLLIILYPFWLKATNILALGTTWTAFQDVLAWIFYGVLHFASPFLAGWWIWGFGPPGAAIVYGLTLGAQNICGLFTHLVFPNAAPWYYDVYPNTTIPTYDLPGNPAGLVRVDQALGTHLYQSAFRKSPVVFGALPSLHAASAVCFSLFVARYGGGRGHILMFIYSTMMFWSTQYLHHHFAVDLVLGTIYSVLAFSIATIPLERLEATHEQEATTRGVDRLLGRPSPHRRSRLLPSHIEATRAVGADDDTRDDGVWDDKHSEQRTDSSSSSDNKSKTVGFWLNSRGRGINSDEEQAIMLCEVSSHGSISPGEDISVASGSGSKTSSHSSLGRWG